MQKKPNEICWIKFQIAEFEAYFAKCNCKMQNMKCNCKIQNANKLVCKKVLTENPKISSSEPIWSEHVLLFNF